MRTHVLESILTFAHRIVTLKYLVAGRAVVSHNERLVNCRTRVGRRRRAKLGVGDVDDEVCCLTGGGRYNVGDNGFLRDGRRKRGS